MSNLQVLKQEIQTVETQFISVQSDNSLSFQREVGFAMQALGNNDFLAKIAINNKQSLLNAVTNVSAIGISLNPAEKQAYLVPRDGAVCLDISYMGLIDLATKSGSIMWAKAELVHSNDRFELDGVDKQPRHIRDPFSSERGEVVGAYCVAKLPNGDYLTEAMSRAELDAIKQRSSSYSSSKGPRGPWVTDEGEMQRKTVVKRASKYWPKSERLAKAIDMLNTEGGEGLQEVNAPKALSDQRMGELKAQAAACGTPEQLTKVWQDGVSELQAHGNQFQYQEFKDHVAQIGEEIKNTVEMPDKG